MGVRLCFFVKECGNDFFVYVGHGRGWKEMKWLRFCVRDKHTSAFFLLLTLAYTMK